jgi:hypothetical protein
MEKTLTKAEALLAMKDGKKITHEYYLPDEYCFMKGGIIFTEDGYGKGDENGEFWAKYQIWETGWSIYK